MMAQNANSAKFESFVGKSKATKELKKLINIAAQYDYPVIITGETGVGKTLVAYIIHSANKRREKAFLHQSCSNIPSELFESELFGHEKGAFTGAIQMKRGKFEIANGGTLFLDEIVDLSTQNQAKLLLFAEKGKFYRVGGDKEISADVRIISASNRNLKKETKAGKFRNDLYFRLNTLEIHIPPLRERRVDIPLFVEEILRIENERNRTRKCISSEAMNKLIDYDFPGNIRELENLIKQAIMHSKGDEIKTNDILLGEGGLGRKRGSVTSAQAAKTLQKYKGNKCKAARELGISRQYLYKILKQKKV
jgi:DNA-binding NtrC family response regulator